MNSYMPTNGNIYEKYAETQRRPRYRRLFRKFILLTMICSLIPLLLVGWGIYIHYSRFAGSRMIHSLQTQVEHHKKVIELFLKERRSKLQLIAHTHAKQDLIKGSKLSDVFDMINREYWSITDLGVIDAAGNHLAYIGPYDLIDKNYAETFWFKQVMEKDLYISDMFMGFRKVPHFIIAVTGVDNGEKWILRATIDTEAFRSLVENVKIGETGEVYLVNANGIFQTSPRFSGKIMEKSSLPVIDFDENIQVRIVDENRQGPPLKARSRQIVSQTWLSQPRWLLVLKQDYAEAFGEVNHANYATLIFLHLAALIILAVTILITRHMITVIKRRDFESDHLNRQLIQTSKLASIGELSAGVAHEINNPLAIILTERQILLDVYNQTPGQNRPLSRQIEESMEQIHVQIQRCKRITQNLLRFARRTQSVIETVNINGFIREVIELMEREAKASGIQFQADLEENLPPLLTDPSQLQQVFLNLINNSMDAHDGKTLGHIHIRTSRNGGADGVHVSIADTGIGIPPQQIEKIFDPFFTTKPVGKGTGLGLSICYSTIKHLGGDISVRSEPGKGTEFTLFLPFRPPPHILQNVAENFQD